MCRLQNPCCSLLMLLIPVALYGQVKEIEIHQLQGLADQFSAEWQQLENRLDYSVQGEKSSAAPLNPSFAYDLEFLDDGSQSEYEHYLYLQKEIRTPGHYRNIRDRRDSRISQMEFQTESERLEWLAATRTGFIQIVLGEREIEMLEIIKNRLDHISEASTYRTEEGEASVLDNQLLQMSRYQLQARIEDQKIETDRLRALWRNRMGFDENVEIRFIGEFEEAGVGIPVTGELLALLDVSPQIHAYREAVDAAQFETAFAQSSRLPSFELTAGYKQMNPNWHGFLVGVAIPLPVLNSSSEAIAQARALERIEQTNLNLLQVEQTQITLQLLDALRNYEQKLEQFPQHLDNPEQFINALSVSYEEGTRSIDEFLTTLNMMADNYQTKFDQLMKYYRIITELEALTGQEFINP